MQKRKHKILSEQRKKNQERNRKQPQQQQQQQQKERKLTNQKVLPSQKFRRAN